MRFKKYAAFAALAVLTVALWLKGTQTSPLSQGAGPGTDQESMQIDRSAVGDPDSKPEAARPAAQGKLVEAAGQEIAQATAEDRRQAAILDEILAARNDNDPRLDRELKILDEGAKRLFEARYQTLPAENRNERGTIVFLLGRNLKSESDFGFLRGVIKEGPCRSLSDCSKDFTESVSSDEHHQDIGTEVTLAYPQLVALKSIDALFAHEGARLDPVARQRALAVLEEAMRSPVAKVAELAQRISERANRTKPRD